MKKFSFALALSALALGSSHAIAGSVINFDSSQAETARTSGPYTVGVVLHVGSSAESIKALGAQAYGSGGQDASLNSVQVGLWDATGSTLLASTTITGASTLVGDYRYNDLASSIALAANTDYLLGAFVGSTYSAFFDGNANSTTPYSAGSGFSLVRNVYVNSGSFHAPLLDGAGQLGRWSPANALDHSVVPEPATLLMFSTYGLIGLSATRRRRQANAKTA